MVVNSGMDTALIRLTRLGFTEYEAKAYFALLKESPLTAYEIAKSSGIPTSKIYEVIRKLEKRRAIQSVHGQRSKMLIPLPPDELMEEVRAAVEENIRAVAVELKDVKAGMDTSYTWHIKDYEGLIHRARRMIDTARDTVLLSVWPSEMKVLLDNLCQAGERGVRIAIIHYGAATVRIGQIYSHPIEDTIYSERGARGFTLAADSREALNGSIVSRRTEAVWSMNESFVIMAEGYIRHDIYQMKILKRLSPVLKKMFGEHYEKMLDVYNDDP